MKIKTNFVIGFFTFLLCMNGVLAAEPAKMLLDQIIFQVNAERWVTTSEANVVVNIDAALDKDDIVKLRQTILDNLQQLAKADWHITQFNRSQDSAGLERVAINAEARVPEKALTSVYQQVKSMSKPGSTFRIERIDFTPSLAELEASRKEVRDLIYQKINSELQQLQKEYPKQEYTLHRVDFSGGMPMAMPLMTKMDSHAEATTGGATVSVSNKVEMTAIVTVAANRGLERSESDAQ